MLPFGERLAAAVRAVGHPLCVGIDPIADRWPDGLDGVQGLETFCRGVVAAVAGQVAAVKPQSAFFEAYGHRGVAALERVIASARSAGLLVVLDAKRGDIGSTATAYATAHLGGDTPADALTLSPWLGPESLAPFLGREGQGVFVLVRTSNPGADTWQGSSGAGPSAAVAKWVADRNAGAPGYGDVGAVVGATLGAELLHWRRAMPRTWLLVPGLGAQGGRPEDVRAALDADGLGILANVSRDALYPRSGRDGASFTSAIHDRVGRLADSLRR